MNVIFRFRASGRVQGVGFRRFVQKTAQSSGVTGWVRNNIDGTVSVEACGPESVVDAFVKRVEAGSFLARVDSIEPIERREYLEDLPESFIITA